MGLLGWKAGCLHNSHAQARAHTRAHARALTQRASSGPFAVMNDSLITHIIVTCW